MPSDPKDLTWIDYLPGAEPPKKRGRKKGSKGGGRPRKLYPVPENVDLRSAGDVVWPESDEEEVPEKIPRIVSYKDQSTLYQLTALF